jgi:hypothetical protein
LTTTLRAAEGPAGCVVDISGTHVGGSNDWLMTIERSGESVHLDVYDVRDLTQYDEYEGTVVADVLTVPLNRFSGAGWCGERGGRVAFHGENHVSGRFSADGHSLTAEEDVSFQLNSGETLSLHYDWSATQQ